MTHAAPCLRYANRVLVALLVLIFLPGLASAQELGIFTSVLDAPGNMVAAGDNFRYRVSYSCNLVVGDCDNAVVTVDLPPELEFVSSFFPPGDVVSGIHSGPTPGGTVTFTFQPVVNAGNAGDLDITVRFPLGTTTNGTMTTNTTDAAESSGDPPLITQMADLPVVTATATPDANVSVALVGGFIDSCEAPGPPGAFPSTYQVTVSPSGASGSVNFVDVAQIVLDLPTGVDTIVPMDGGIYDAMTNTVTWGSQGPVPVGSSVTVSVGVNFPDPPFSDGDMVLSAATALVDALDGPPNDPTLLPFGPLPFNHTVTRFAETTGSSVSKVFGNGRPTTLPPAEGQSFSYQVAIGNTGNIALDTLTVVDDGDGMGAVLDPGITIDTVSTGAYSPAPTSVTINITGDMGSTPSITSPNGSTDTVLNLAGMLMAGERVDQIEWVFNGGAPAGMSASTAATVNTTVNAGFAAGTTIDNHVTSTWTASPSMPGPCGGGIPAAGGGDTTNFPFDVNDPYTYLQPSKTTTTSGPYFPGDTVGFSFGIANNALANDPAVDVVVTDLLPEFLTYQMGTMMVTSGATGVVLAMPSDFEVIPNYNGTGRTLLRWNFTGDLDPGESITITFDTTLEVGVIFGSLGNTMGMTYTDPGVIQFCAGSSFVDAADLDGDSDDLDLQCSSSSSITIAAVAQLPSIKQVRGQCDPTFASPGPGTTVRGGNVEWRVEVGNNETVPMGNFVLIDIFPDVGDTGIRDLTPRLSTFRPLLIEPISPPPGGAVFYSLEGNPCRPEVGGPTSGCDPPNWTPIPPTPISDARAIKIEFGDLVLNPLDVLEFSWNMAIPADAPTDGSQAFNSFAFGSNRQDDGGFLGAEPNKVGIDVTCTPMPPDDAMLGDFVWLDTNGDGDQDGGEMGINGVPADLFDPGPDGIPRTGDDILLLSTVTADDDMGNPGWYKFSALPAGDYYVRFTPPQNYEVTVQDAGGDDTVDSDTDPLTACTDVVTLAVSENNPDLDMGLLAPVDASLGNYTWFDRNGDGVQNEALTDGLNGVTVNLYADDGDGNPEPGGQDGTPLQTTVTANDPYGNPGFYIFEELIPGVPYFVEFIEPVASTSFTSRNSGGDDTVDSDARNSNGTTPVVTLMPGEHNPTLDAGFVLLSGTLALGNTVWLDEDGNGVIDAAGDDDGNYDPLVPEAGINGVRMNLYFDLNGDNAIQVNEFMGSTQTLTLAGKSGRYRFVDLPPGDFVVEVDPSNFAVGEPLEGLVSSTGFSADPNDDVDNDDSGDPVLSAVVSRSVTLADDTEPTPDANDDLLDDDNINFTIDFGFIPGLAPAFDFGDNPDAGVGTAQGNYRTVGFDGGAFHPLLSPMGPYLGACVDSDDGTNQNFTASADDSAGAATITNGTCATLGDDEDGVMFSTLLLTLGGTVDVTLSSSSALPCTTSAWVDWNRDGVFDDFAPEKILTDVAVGAFPAIPVPANAIPGFTYARFRCSTPGGDTPNGSAVDGEVEDYRLEVRGVDLGDAPDMYSTLLASGGPVHSTDPNIELYMGNCVETEPDGQPSTLADGDDLGLGTSRIGDCVDDEDGVNFDTMLVRGQMASLTVTASMPARLDAWIDLDGSGSFAGADQIVVNQPLVVGPNVFNFMVPANAAVGRTYARFRMSTAGGLPPTGPAADGEVEDYAVIVKGFDFGDLPDATYPTLIGSGGAQHIVDPASNVFLGACVDPEDDGQPMMNADGDDVGATNSPTNTGSAGICAGNDDEDGIAFNTMFIACQTAQIAMTGGTLARLDGWLDFHPVSIPGFDPADQVITNVAVANGIFNIPVPCDADSDVLSYGRFRFSSAGGLSVSGLAMDGEVEDYTFFLKGSDFGDAPDSYGTTSGSPTGTGARHGVDARPGSEFVLGSCADTEVNGPAAGMANDDDVATGTSTAGTCTGNDDEDGVTFGGGMAMAVACSTSNALTVTLTNNAGVGTPLLDAWIDWNGDGDFDHPAEHLFGGTSATLTGPSTNLTYDVPCTALPQDTSYARFRLSSTGGLTPIGPVMDGEVEDYAFQVKGIDLGDAPDTYPTLVGSGGPTHTVVPSLFLGSCVDTEADGQPSGSAADDDANAGSSFQGAGPCTDDEDGVVFDTPVKACQNAQITVTASAAGVLNAFFDFDADGTFDLPRDQIFTDEPLGIGGNVLNFFAPCDSADATTYARFRLASVGGLSFSGPADDGEVEDYLVLVEDSDFGDAPDTYGTSIATSGPLHGLDAMTGLYLGACVDAEVDGQPSLGADGDDTGVGISDLGTCAGNDDEDGVVFDTMIIACEMAQITVTASTGGGLLDAWIDMDGSTDFTGAADQIFASEPLSAGANVLTFPVPCDATPSDTYARFRISTSGGLGTGGPSIDGEVEDYAVTVKGVDFGDLPDNYSTTTSMGGAYHGVDPSSPFYLGSCVDTEADGQPSTDADTDDSGLGTGTVGTCVGNDDEDGVVFDTLVIACLAADITVTSSSPGFLDAWLDFNGNGIFDAATERIFASEPLVAGANPLTFNVPCSAAEGVTYTRFRLSSTGGLPFNGPSMDGEVEDYTVTVQGLDYGDSPSPYPTVQADNGAHHAVLPVDNPTLGVLVDTELDGQPDPNHLGDDSNGVDDEDGIEFFGVLIPGTDDEVQITTGSTGGLVSVWIDFNGDGDWDDAGEQVVTDLSLGANVTSIETFPVPVFSPSGSVCVRARISSVGSLTSVGLAPDGEVEDYTVGIGVEDPGIGLAKELRESIIEPGRMARLFFDMRLENLGNVPLSDISVIANFAVAFADAAGFTIESLTSAELVVNPAFDGDTDIELLALGNTLAVGEMAMITVEVLLDLSASPGPFECSSIATGMSPEGDDTTDISQDGDNTDPDGDGTATDDNDPTVITFGFPIPTMGEWGLIAMALMLALLGLRGVRRREASS